MAIRALALAILIGAVGCSTTPAPTETDSGADTDFGAEGGTDRGTMARRAETPSRTMGDGDFKTIYFDFDDYSLRPDARNDLRHNAEVLQANPSMRIQIGGHADERGSAEYNLALGKRRAEAAKRYLSDLGVSGSRIETLSFGEEVPAVRGHNETAWSKNRRGEFDAR